MDLTTMTPAQVDQAWAEAMAPAYEISAKLADTRRSIGRYERHGGYAVPDYLIERAEKQQAELAEAMQQGKPFDEEYDRRGGWTRYLLVANSNGHVHRMPGHCGALRVGTLVQPVYELSGQDDAGVVTECGHAACTRCFPEAPVASRAQRERASAERKAQKAAERQQRAAEKEARKTQREEAAAFKANAALDKYQTSAALYDAWINGRITDATWDILNEAGKTAYPPR